MTAADPADNGGRALDVRWIHGSPPGGPPDPPIQVHAVGADTFIMRQSKDLTFEAPFLYLLCGRERALLLDTGAVRLPEGTAGSGGEAAPGREAAPGGSAPPDGSVRATVDGLLAEREVASPGYELVVAHTHGHGDHVAGDGQFAGRLHTTVVARDVAAVQKFFGFTSWPEEIVTFDLGGRELQVTGSPGHHAAAITVYDPVTGFLLTGDTIYPGRLYVQDMPAFVASVDRLAEFAAAHPVSHVLGCHIEMTRSGGRDYPIWCRYQPDEPPPEMSVAQLLAVRDAAHSVAERPGAHAFGDFIIYNGMRPGAVARLMTRGYAGRLRGRLRRR